VVLADGAIRADLQTTEERTGTAAIAGRAEEPRAALGAAAWDEPRKYGVTDGNLLLCPEAEVVSAKPSVAAGRPQICAIPTSLARLTESAELAAEHPPPEKSSGVHRGA